MKTNYFFKLTTFLLLFVFLGCQEDNTTLDTVIDQKLTVNKKKFSDYSELPELTYSLVIENKDFSKSFSKSSTDFNLYDFVIDSSKVVEVSYGNSVWYTMAIHREDQAINVFENLVVVVKANEEPTAYLYKYIPDDAYIAASKIYDNPFFTGIKKNIALNYTQVFSTTARVECTTTSSYVCTNHENGNGAVGPGCFLNDDGGAHISISNRTQCIAIDDYLEGMPATSEEVDDSGNGGEVAVVLIVEEQRNNP